MRRSPRVVALALMVVAVVAWSLFLGSDPFSGRVTSYSATCLQRAAARCAAAGRTLEPSVFQVSVARQQVEVLADNGQRRPLRSCTVTSKHDWHCRALDESIELGFSAGRPWQRVRGSDVADLVFLPRWRYLWLKSGEGTRGLRPSGFLFRR